MRKILLDSASHSPHVQKLEQELLKALAEEEEGTFGKLADREALGLAAKAGQSVWPIDSEPDLDHIFRYHSPRPDQLPKYKAIRDTGKFFAQCILDNVPNCADRTAAIRKIREAVMTANAAIALGGRL